jgi:Na+-driven multidrug efflux pump
MNFKSFFYTIIGMTLLGISLGYVLGFYTHKHAENNYWFYFSVPVFIFASFFIIYGTLFLKKDH